jgi:NAD(P)-dependent dehydrogenase (short-subunit alcohol dehydrogenase family)
VFERLDVTSEEDWARVVAATEGREGRIDVLVNNARGAADGRDRGHGARRVRARRAREPGRTFLGIKTVAPVMKRAGRGSIVNVASIDGMSAKNGTRRLRVEQMGGARHDARRGARARQAGIA